MKVNETVGPSLAPNVPKDPNLTALLDAIASAIPFIGYEDTGASKLCDQVEEAFHQYTGQTWSEYKQANKKQPAPAPVRNSIRTRDNF